MNCDYCDAFILCQHIKEAYANFSTQHCQMIKDLDTELKIWYNSQMEDEL